MHLDDEQRQRLVALFHSVHQGIQVFHTPFSGCVREKRQAFLLQGAALHLHKKTPVPILHMEVQAGMPIYDFPADKRVRKPVFQIIHGDGVWGLGINVHQQIPFVHRHQVIICLAACPARPV